MSPAPWPRPPITSGHPGEQIRALPGPGIWGDSGSPHTGRCGPSGRGRQFRQGTAFPRAFFWGDHAVHQWPRRGRVRRPSNHGMPHSRHAQSIMIGGCGGCVDTGHGLIIDYDRIMTPAYSTWTWTWTDMGSKHGHGHGHGQRRWRWR